MSEKGFIMNKVEMIIAGAALAAVSSYIVLKIRKNSKIEKKIESEVAEASKTEENKQETLREQENILKQVQEQAKSSDQTKSEEMQSRHLEADELMKTSLDKIFNGDDSVSVQPENEQSFDEMSDDLADLLK